MGINRKTVGDVLRNAGIDRAGTKAKKIISLHEKGLSTGQIADKIGCTERNMGVKQKSPGTDVSEDRLLLLESGAFTGMPDSVAVPLLSFPPCFQLPPWLSARSLLPPASLVRLVRCRWCRK